MPRPHRARSRAAASTSPTLGARGPASSGKKPPEPMSQASSCAGPPQVETPAKRHGNGLPLRRHSIPPPRAKGLVNAAIEHAGVLAGAKLPHVFPTARALTGPDVGVCPGQRPAGRITDKSAGGRRNLYPTQVYPQKPPTQTCWSGALFNWWQVQDSNLRRHTPTDLQNDDAQALTSSFAAMAETCTPFSHRPEAWPRTRATGATRAQERPRSPPIGVRAPSLMSMSPWFRS
jgi:hypothetical protein